MTAHNFKWRSELRIILMRDEKSNFDDLWIDKEIWYFFAHLMQ
jgi:hypothetical protein